MATIEYDYIQYVGPGQWGYHDSTDILFSSFSALYSLNDYTSMIFQLSKSGVMDTVGFYVYGKITGSLSYFEAGIKTLDAAGVPTSINFGGSSGTVLSTDSFSVGWNWIELSQPGTGTVGDFAGVVLKQISDIAITGSVRVSLDTIGYDLALPRHRVLSGISTYTGPQPMIAVQYTDDFTIGMPATSYFSYQGDLADSPDEFGAVFSVPIRTRCCGVKLSGNSAGNNSPFYVFLYDEFDSILSSLYVGDEDYAWDASVAPQQTVMLRFEPAWIEADTTYRIALRSANATNPVYLGGITLVTGTYRYCMPEGSRWKATYRTNTGSWTDVDNQVPYIAMLSDKISIETASSSGSSTATSTGQGSYGWAY